MIEELKSVLVPDEEIVRIREYSERMRTTAAARAREQSELRNVVSELESAVNTLRESTTRSAADWRSLSEHAAAMQAMENDKFDLAKQINEQESALSALEAEIEQLRRESDMIDDWSVDRDIDMDKDALVLQLFRGLGFVPYGNAHDKPIQSLIVRSVRRTAASSFDIDECEASPAELATRLWAAAE